MVYCSGRWQLLTFWWHSGTGCDSKFLIAPHGFGHHGTIHFRRNVQARFGSLGKKEGEATNDHQLIWDSMHAQRQEVAYQIWQIEHSWLWFTRCEIMHTYPWTILKPSAQMWGTGRSWSMSMEQDAGLKKLYCSRVTLNCTMEQEDVGEEYMGVYIYRKLMNDPIYGQTLYNSYHSNAFKLKLGYNLK